MDKKDEIISMQLDLIRQMTEHNVRRLSDDIWGRDKKRSQTDDEIERINTDGARSNSKDALKKDLGAVVDDENNVCGEPEQKNFDDPRNEPDGKEDEIENLDDLMAELDEYIGLESVKEEIKSLINMAKVYKLRRDNDLPVTNISLHIVFSGNPGTGKTMIARFMARVYRSIGILSKGSFVETDRGGLVAGYIGQTAIKTGEVLKSALGGVLFIDEAYSLVGKGENDFGYEAIDTILKFMEDHRDDIVIIVAGYTELMEEFIDSNPGLRSRFNKYVYFEDYNVGDLLEIFKLQCKKGFYNVEDDALKEVEKYLSEKTRDSEDFGNARGVRNTFEKILTEQANRLASMDEVTKEDLMRITADDVARALDLNGK